MNKNRFILILIICIFFLNLPFTVGSTTEKTKLIYTDRDSYISMFDPISNYGAIGFLHTNSFENGAFIHFDLSSKPANITKVEVVLNFFYVNVFTAVTIRQADNNAWGEYTITWTNAPSHSTILTSGAVSDEGRYSFELPLASHQWNEVTLVVISTGYDIVTSKDYGSLIYEGSLIYGEDAPHIKYTYLASVEDPPSPPPSIPGYNIFIVIGVLGIFSILTLKRNNGITNKINAIKNKIG